MALDVPSWVNLSGWIMSLFLTILFYRNSRARWRALAKWQEGTVTPALAQVATHNGQIGHLDRAVANLVPPDAQPTPRRERLPPASTATPPPASTSAPGVPRIHVDIHRSPFPAEVYAVLARSDGQPLILNVDARDVDVREGTMPVNLLHVRAGLVKVELPPERPRRRVAWLSQMAVLDCPDAPMPGPPAPVGAEGDREGIIPGDPITKDVADPADILRALAFDGWTERSGGGIVAVVETSRVSSDGSAYFFTFTLPALGGYRYRLFRIEHGAGLYPVRISRGRAAEEVLEVSDEHNLYDALRRILDGPATLAIVRQLRSMIAEKGPQGRGGLPSMTTDDEPEDERTRFYTGRARRRPTLTGAPQEPPKQPPTAGSLDDARREDTLVSAGVGPPSGPEDGSAIVEAEHEDGTRLSERARDVDGREVPPPSRGPKSSKP
jgi:hypothetical protein